MNYLKFFNFNIILKIGNKKDFLKLIEIFNLFLNRNHQ